jgi:lysophospholipase L1-like esterase
MKRILFSFVPVVFLFLISEVLLYVMDWPKITAAFEHNAPFWSTDPDLEKKKFSHKEERAHFFVSSNEDGLRNTSITTTQLESSTKRIMTLGCSTTFGWGVSDNESYPAVLHKLIQEKNSNYEVVNGGQPGFTTFQGLWFWNKILKNYNPDIVVIGYIVQDSRKAAYSDRSQAILQRDNRYLKNHILYRSKSYLALRSVLGGVQIRAKERTQGDDSTGVYRVSPEEYGDNLKKIVGEVQKMGGTPILFGYPLERTGYTKQHRTKLKDVAKELGDILHFDPQNQMEEASRQTQMYFSRDRGHANVVGNAKIAEWVYGFLQKQKIVK